MASRVPIIRPQLLTIDGIVKILFRSRCDQVSGHIALPSQTISEPLSDYANRLGMKLLPNPRDPNRFVMHGFVHHAPGYPEDQCYMAAHSLGDFIIILDRCRREGQSFPYYIMATHSDRTTLTFRAVDAEHQRVRIVEHGYICPQDLSPYISSGSAD